jgi:hypothetical protein
MARRVNTPSSGGVSDHTLLTNIGTNTHAQIDTHIAAVAPHSGHATTGHDHDADYSDITHDHAALYSVLAHHHDATYVNVTGDTMTGDLIVPDEAYGGSWDSNLEVPTKNAVYDKIEALVIGGGGYTDEQAQDAVGTILVDSASINFTYTDATPEITAVAIFGSGAGTVAEGNHTHSYQPLDDQLTDFAGLTQASDKLPYFDSATTMATADFTAFGRSLLDDANAAAGIATLGLDADLATFSLPASTTISAFGKTLVDDADAAAVLTTLGITPTVAELNHVDGVTSAIQTQIDGKQALDTDLTTIAGLTATTDNVIQSVSSAWASRTPAQLKTTLALVKGDVGLGNVDNTSDATKLANVITQSVAIQFGDGTNVIAVGDKRRFDIPVGHTLIRWRIWSSISGSITFSVWRDTFANIPVAADEISTSRPTLSAAVTAEDSTITDWSEVGNAGDLYLVNVESVATVTDVVLILWYTRALNV